MDSLTAVDFNDLFGRVCLYVDMKRAFTAEEIDRRLDAARKRNIERLKKTKSKAEKFRLRRAIRLNRQLKERGFSRTAINRAIANPRGLIALTFRFGLRRAKEIRLRLKSKTSKWHIRRHG